MIWLLSVLAAIICSSSSYSLDDGVAESIKELSYNDLGSPENQYETEESIPDHDPNFLDSGAALGSDTDSLTDEQFEEAYNQELEKANLGLAQETSTSEENTDPNFESSPFEEVPHETEESALAVPHDIIESDEEDYGRDSSFDENSGDLSEPHTTDESVADGLEDYIDHLDSEAEADDNGADDDTTSDENANSESSQDAPTFEENTDPNLESSYIEDMPHETEENSLAVSNDNIESDAEDYESDISSDENLGDNNEPHSTDESVADGLEDYIGHLDSVAEADDDTHDDGTTSADENESQASDEYVADGFEDYINNLETKSEETDNIETSPSLDDIPEDEYSAVGDDLSQPEPEKDAETDSAEDESQRITTRPPPATQGSGQLPSTEASDTDSGFLMPENIDEAESYEESDYVPFDDGSISDAEFDQEDTNELSNGGMEMVEIDEEESAPELDDELMSELEELDDFPNEKELVDEYVNSNEGSIDEFESDDNLDASSDVYDTQSDVPEGLEPSVQETTQNVDDEGTVLQGYKDESSLEKDLDGDSKEMSTTTVLIEDPFVQGAGDIESQSEQDSYEEHNEDTSTETQENVNPEDSDVSDVSADEETESSEGLESSVLETTEEDTKEYEDEEVVPSDIPLDTDTQSVTDSHQSSDEEVPYDSYNSESEYSPFNPDPSSLVVKYEDTAYMSQEEILAYAEAASHKDADEDLDESETEPESSEEVVDVPGDDGDQVIAEDADDIVQGDQGLDLAEDVDIASATDIGQGDYESDSVEADDDDYVSYEPPSDYGSDIYTDGMSDYPNGYFEEHQEIDEVEVDIPGQISQGEFYEDEYEDYIEKNEKALEDSFLSSYHTITYFLFAVLLATAIYVVYTYRHRFIKSGRSDYAYTRLGEQYSHQPLV